MKHNNHALNLQPRYLHLLFAEPYRSTTKTFTCMGFSQLSMVSWVAWFSSSIHGQMKRFAGWDYVVLILLNTLRFSPIRETDIHKKLSNFAKPQFLNDKIYSFGAWQNWCFGQFYHWRFGKFPWEKIWDNWGKITNT